MERDVNVEDDDLGANATDPTALVRTVGAGANAAETATITARIRKESFAILGYLLFC